MEQGTTTNRMTNDRNYHDVQDNKSPNDKSQWVSIIDGKHKGRVLRFVQHTAQRVAVELPETNKIIYLLPEHVDLFTPTAPPTAKTQASHPHNSLLNTDKNETAQVPTFSSSWVYIVQGKYKDQTLRYVTHTKQRIAVQLPQGKVVYLDPTHVQELVEEGGQNDAPPPISTKPCTVPPRPVTPLEVQNNNNNNNENRHQNAAAGGVDIVPDTMEEQRAKQGEDDLCSVIGHVHTQDRHGNHHHVVNEDYMDEDESFVTACETPNDLDDVQPGDLIHVTSGKYAGRTVIFVKRTPQRIGITLPGESKVRYLLPSSFMGSPRDDDDETMETTSKDTEADAFVMALRAQLPRGARVVVKNVTQENLTHTLMGAMFGNSHGVVFVDMNNLESIDTLPLHVTVPYHDKNETTPSDAFCLAAVKVHDKAKSLTASYLRSSHHDHVACILQQRVGGLDQLVPCKVAARVELLLSTAAFPIVRDNTTWTATNFCQIPERSHAGCGFIPRHLLDKLLLPASLSSAASDVCAIQVRIAIPSMGLFKGMLMEKPGIDKIQLPQSMKKVEAAVVDQNTSGDNDTDAAWIMLNQGGVFPYNTRIQQAASGFQEARPISAMARWTLAQKGVSQSYLNKPNRQHASLVGVADPTDGIPPECIFITGVVCRHLKDEFGNEIIISRFPMTEASDARKLRILWERPSCMTTQDWEFLCAKPFGLVIFGNAAPGHRPMPEQISQGDLDGDQYFVCWDPYIIENAVIGDRPVFASKNPPVTPPMNWWTAALEFMGDIKSRKRSQTLIGRLHDRWLGKLRANDQSDAVAFGRAYKDALVRAKHGGKVDLPARLCSEVPYDIRCYLNPI